MLDPGQQLAYEEEIADRHAWWDDVMGHILDDAELPMLGGEEELPPMMADEKPTKKDVTGGGAPPSS